MECKEIPPRVTAAPGDWFSREGPGMVKGGKCLKIIVPGRRDILYG